MKNKSPESPCRSPEPNRCRTHDVSVERLVREERCGSVFNIKSFEETERLQRIAVEESRLGIPLLIGADVIHGFRTIFPINLAVAASWDPAAAESLARVSAREASAMGIHWTFSPMCDVSRDPRWGRVSEGAGEDPYLGARVAEAMVRGYQGDLSDPSSSFFASPTICTALRELMCWISTSAPV